MGYTELPVPEIVREFRDGFYACSQDITVAGEGVFSAGTILLVEHDRADKRRLIIDDGEGHTATLTDEDIIASLVKTSEISDLEKQICSKEEIKMLSDKARTSAKERFGLYRLELRALLGVWPFGTMMSIMGILFGAIGMESGNFHNSLIFTIFCSVILLLNIGLGIADRKFEQKDEIARDEGSAVERTLEERNAKITKKIFDLDEIPDNASVMVVPQTDETPAETFARVAKEMMLPGEFEEFNGLYLWHTKKD